jgi:hypothetical protein
MRQVLSVDSSYDSPPLTLCSPALRVGAGKSGVGEGEWKVSSMQISVLFSCQDFTFWENDTFRVLILRKDADWVKAIKAYEYRQYPAGRTAL